METKEMFKAIVSALPRQPSSFDTSENPGPWSDGDIILCGCEADRETIYNFLALFDHDNNTIITGYFDPFEDDEQDDYTGF